MCGRAQYRTAAFLAKNRDFVVGEHQALLQASARPFVAGLFPGEPDSNGNAPVCGNVSTVNRCEFEKNGEVAL